MELAIVWQVAGAVLASLGGGGLIVFGLSSWLGKVWAERIMERERAELTRSIEVLKADLAKSIERNRVEVEEQSSQRLDAVTRKREVYSAFVTSSRVLATGSEKTKEQQDAFLNAYARSYLWASEEVVVAIRNLVELLIQKSDAVKNRTPEVQALDLNANEALRTCMLAMRRDVGFENSKCQYRPITF